jgi:polyphosphate:AMP phosphotransferase
MEPDHVRDHLNEQFELAESRRGCVLVLVNGVDGVGKGALVNRLYEWMDAHYLVTLAYERPTDEERARPYLWRYWRDMPPRGRIGIVIGSWYGEPLRARVEREIDEAGFLAELESINRFEAMLASEGVSLVKLWLRGNPDQARKRPGGARRNGGESQPVVKEWSGLKGARAGRRLLDTALEAARVTSRGIAPWHVIAAGNGRYRDAAAGTILLDALRRVNRNANDVPPTPPEAAGSTASELPDIPKPSLLRALDLSRSIPDEEYRPALGRYQQRLTELTTGAAFARAGLVCVFEGNDAAGKGGALGRVRQALDPRRFRVHQIAAPSDEERARPYLWRFWRRLPAHGHTGFFDRSWYGRVLVERVEGFAAPEEWGRAYAEINDFERQLADDGYVVVKFWLAISQEEQLRRFEAREAVPFKRFKITPEDWRNREKWPAYELAVNEMIDRTSTPYAPWTLVEAEHKRFARIKVLATIVERLEAALAH